MSWQKKLLFSGIVVVGFFLALEATLAILGIAPITDLEDPFVGFSNQQPLLKQGVSDTGEVVLRTAPNKLVWFNDQTMPLHKGPAVKRVFCLGGSTTYGRPYWDSTSYVGWLRELLPVVDSTTSWQVVNAGGVSYASYRVAAVMQELAAYEPDLFIVYCGQNEFLERRTYDHLFSQPTFKTNLHAALVSTRTWAAIDRIAGRYPDKERKVEVDAATSKTMLPGEVDEILNHTIGPADYHRDEAWKGGVIQHYEANLHRMVNIATASGAGILFVIPASNEKDCSPFKSEPGADDSQNADLQYRLGLEHFAAGRFQEAQAAFRRAINEDICPLRAIDPLVDAMARVAAQRGVPLVDFPSLLRQQCQEAFGHACLGEEYFLDHVHPNLEIHQQLALWILDRLQQDGEIASREVTPEEVNAIANRIEANIDRRAVGISLRNLAKVLHWSGKFSEALPRAADALAILPHDPESTAILADCLEQTGQIEAAAAEYERLFQYTPPYVRAYLPFGELLIDRGEFERAKAYLVMAVAEYWDNPRASYFLGIAESELGNHDLALESFQHSYDLRPNHPATMAWIGNCHVALGNLANGKQWYQSCLKLDPSNIDCRFRLGLLALKQQQFAAAASEFEHVLAIDPEHADAQRNLRIARQLE